MGRSLTRRDLLRWGAAGLATTALVGNPAQAAADAAAATPSSLLAQMRRAARAYQVPVVVLLAMGYVNTRLEMPATAPGTDAAGHEATTATGCTV